MPESAKEASPKLRHAARLLGRLARLLRPYWRRLGKGIVLGFFTSFIAMALPYLTKLLIDKVYPTQDVSLMHVLVGGILAISVGQALMRMIQGYYTLHVNARLSNAVRLLFFNHLQHLSMRFFDEHRVGEITSRFGDVSKALASVTSVFQTVFLQGMYLLLVPPFLFLLEWKLALVAIITVPLVALVTGLSARLLRKYWKRSSGRLMHTAFRI